MKSEDKLLETHKFYNLSRYLFLNIEWNYNNIVEKTGLTLPQLRVLFILRIFENVSITEISKIGCWTPPTVTNMIKLLMKNEYVTKKETSNKKEYSLSLTEKGMHYLKLNQLKHEDGSYMLQLLSLASEENLSKIIDILKSIVLNIHSGRIFEYIDKVNELGLKVNYEGFNNDEVNKLKQITCFHNLLRVIVISIENHHRNLLIPFNITYPQLRCLWILNVFPGINSLELSKISHLAPSTENVIVKNLYEKNLIHKEKSPVRNSLYLFISNSAKELLIKEFEANQKNFLIYKNIDFLSESKLFELNKFMYKYNLILGNNFVADYIDKTSLAIKEGFSFQS